MGISDNISTFQTGVYRVTREPLRAIVNGLPVVTPPFSSSIGSITPYDSAHPSTTNLITITAHGLTTGYGPVWISTDPTNPNAAQPGGTDPLVASWVIAVDANDLRLAASKADALSATPIQITDAGVGALTLSTSFMMAASVRPVQGSLLKDLPEGQSVEDSSVVFTLLPLYTKTPDYEPDVVTIDGYDERITKVAFYRISGFYRAYSERLAVL